MAKGERDLAKKRHWREVLKRQQSSGFNVRAYCQREEIVESAFHFWRRTIRARDDRAKPALPVPPFVPVYTTQGFLAIDNNASERALKRVALVGKIGCLQDNDSAAENAARLWSLIASCERHGVDPQRYLTSVLAKIGTTPAEKLDQFLPEVWGQEDKEEPLADEK